MDTRAVAALAVLDALLIAFSDRYAGLKRAAAGLDFDDLELGVRDLLLARDDLRRRWAGRFDAVMVDEFQDVNPLQAEILTLLGRDRLFAVGDRLQSIYGFRHADVGIFDRAAAELGGRGRLATLQRNFRSRRELLDAIDLAFDAAFGEGGFLPLEAGRADADAPSAEPPVELLVCDQTGWDGARRAWRSALAPGRGARAGAPASAPSSTPAAPRGTSSSSCARRGTWPCTSARWPTATSPPTSWAGAGSGRRARCRTSWPGSRSWPTRTTSRACGRCWPRRSSASPATRWSWSRRPPAAADRDPWSALADALAGWRGSEDDRARLASFRERLAAERAGAARCSLEELLDRAVQRTGYDLALLGATGGQRRMANVRKLLRLARAHEAAEGPDLRGFLDRVAQLARGQAAGDREGEAPVEGDTVHAVRLMTVHRAKGLEFEVVCVADLGRGRPNGRGPLRVSADGRVGLRLAVLGGGDSEPALDWAELADAEARAEAAEERRLFYVAATRARERLILSGAADLDDWPDAVKGPPIAWLAPAFAGGMEALRSGEPITRERDGRPVRIAVTRVEAPDGVKSFFATPASGVAKKDLTPDPQHPSSLRRCPRCPRRP